MRVLQLTKKKLEKEGKRVPTRACGHPFQSSPESKKLMTETGPHTPMSLPVSVYTVLFLVRFVAILSDSEP